MRHDCFQVLELDGWRLRPLRILLKTVELLGSQVLVERTGAQALDPATGKAIRLVGKTHFFIKRQAAVGRVEQRILLRAVDGQLVEAALAVVDKLQVYFLTKLFYITVAPLLEREG